MKTKLPILRELRLFTHMDEQPITILYAHIIANMLEDTGIPCRMHISDSKTGRAWIDDIKIQRLQNGICVVEKSKESILFYEDNEVVIAIDNGWSLEKTLQIPYMDPKLLNKIIDRYKAPWQAYPKSLTS